MKKCANKINFSLMLLLIYICILLLLNNFSNIKCENLNEITASEKEDINVLGNLNLNMQLKQNLKEKLYQEFSGIASAYADFHEAILDFFNKVINLDINSEEIKYAYLKVVEYNNHLLKLNKGFDDDFFRGKISKKLVEKFFDKLISYYDSLLKSEDKTLTTEEREIYKSMVDNYHLIINENKAFQKSEKGFQKYKIMYKRQLKESVIGSYPIIIVEKIEISQNKSDL